MDFPESPRTMKVPFAMMDLSCLDLLNWHCVGLLNRSQSELKDHYTFYIAEFSFWLKGNTDGLCISPESGSEYAKLIRQARIRGTAYVLRTNPYRDTKPYCTRVRLVPLP